MLSARDHELFPRGGSDVWDTPQASAILLDEFFASESALWVVYSGGALQASASPSGLQLYLNTGVRYAKASPGSGDKAVGLYSGGDLKAL